MSGSTSSSTVTPAPTQEAIGSPSVIPDGPVTNPSTPNIIGGASGGSDTKPDYTLDESTPIEKEDGTTTTIGESLSDVDALKKKTSDLSDDGTAYTGDASGASFKSTDGKTEDTGAGLMERAVTNTTTLEAVGKQLGSLSADGKSYTGDVTNATGGVKAQTAPAALTDAPTAADFNGLVTLLTTAGVLK